MERPWAQACIAVGIALTIAGCTPAASGPPAQVRFTRSVDLSQIVRQDMPLRPGEPQTRIERSPDGAFTRLEIGAHTGSLLEVVAAPDADLHVVEQLGPRDLVLPVVVLDMRDQAQDQPDFSLGVAAVAEWERVNGQIPRGSLVLLATGWDVRWGDAQAYMNIEANTPQVPHFAAETAALLLDERGASGLGIDAPGVQYVPLSGHRLLLENLTSLEQLPATGATIVIGALRLQATQSSPARVLALVP